MTKISRIMALYAADRMERGERVVGRGYWTFTNLLFASLPSTPF
jgi:hypothetical protein